MTRDPKSTYTNMNGLWQFELAAEADGANPPFGVELKQTILVPFPLESCLSGAFQWPTYSKYMWYRKLFDAPASSRKSTTPTTTLLHFGAVDWNTTVYLNGVLLGNHVGGYDGFTFTLPASLLKPAANELYVLCFFHDLVLMFWCLAVYAATNVMQFIYISLSLFYFQDGSRV